MKKYLALLVPAAYLTLAFPALATTTSINSPCGAGEFSPLCNLTAGSIGPLVGSLLQFIFVIAVLVALFFLVYGGFRWLVSSGDKTQVAAAREHIVAAVIGLVIIFLSYFILTIILAFFGIDLKNLSIPTIPGA